MKAAYAAPRRHPQRRVPAHARLVESEFAERFGMSRTPVREVLQRLEAEGFVTSERRAWTVPAPSGDEICNRYEIRASLEGYAAGLAARRSTKADRAEMRTALDRGRLMSRRARATCCSTSTSGSTGRW